MNNTLTKVLNKCTLQSKSPDQCYGGAISTPDEIVKEIFDKQAYALRHQFVAGNVPKEVVDAIFDNQDEFLCELDANKEELTKPESRKQAEERLSEFKKTIVDTLSMVVSGQVPPKELLRTVALAITLGVSGGTMTTALTLIKEKTGGEAKPPEPVICPK